MIELRCKCLIISRLKGLKKEIDVDIKFIYLHKLSWLFWLFQDLYHVQNFMCQYWLRHLKCIFHTSAWDFGHPDMKGIVSVAFMASLEFCACIVETFSVHDINVKFKDSYGSICSGFYFERWHYRNFIELNLIFLINMVIIY